MEGIKEFSIYSEYIYYLIKYVEFNIFLSNLFTNLFVSNFQDLKITFPRQSLKRFTFRVKLNDSIFFLLGYSPIVKLI